MRIGYLAFSILKSKGASSKLFLGGIFTLLSFTVVFAFAVIGYIMRALCSGLEGRTSKLPDWKDLKGLFLDGLQPTLIIFAYSTPIIFLVIANINLVNIDMYYEIFLWVTGLILILALSILLPIALIRSIVCSSVRSAFEIKKIVVYITQNALIYLTAWAAAVTATILAFTAALMLLGIFARFYAAFGVIEFFVMIAAILIVMCFLYFTAAIMIVYIFASAYRLSRPFSDDRFGVVRASITMPPPLHIQEKK